MDDGDVRGTAEAIGEKADVHALISVAEGIAAVACPGPEGEGLASSGDEATFAVFGNEAAIGVIALRAARRRMISLPLNRHTRRHTLR
jgi:hypothetical protein